MKTIKKAPRKAPKNIAVKDENLFDGAKVVGRVERGIVVHNVRSLRIAKNRKLHFKELHFGDIVTEIKLLEAGSIVFRVEGEKEHFGLMFAIGAIVEHTEENEELVDQIRDINHDLQELTSDKDDLLSRLNKRLIVPKKPKG